ncbi:BNI4-like protein [Emericellopsis cladophorae]|uniref:BNI4-like protein n=1 Tax=Emericellopsis cladophorae TaxID=2686198 RepID=A0A9Q0BGM3_9HYPO|nr:BNI4-like protein [Emericellopsis cladophorae]KAI6783860.1 BNI4-like protein [Emericellopsis cladophorae]
MLQTRPTSATGRMPSSQQQPIPQYGANQAPRSSYHSNANLTGYRGSSTPVQQYAFQATPTLNQPYRMNAAEYDPSVTHHRFPNYGPPVTNSSPGGTRDDTAILQARQASANRSAPVPASTPSPAASDDARHAPKQEQSAKQINVPPRDSSANVGKRITTPSPLSKPVTMGAESADGAAPNTANLSSPAAKQLAAINQKGSKPKGKTSRLRRAFSFGSAAELRKVDEEGGASQKPEPSRLHKEPSPYEAYDAEQARIAEAQEAAGIGSSIYGGRFFGGSTDNLSISSTASSASIMIRKMGRGMKKSTRNLAGLFRPKSVIGVAPADGPVSQEGSQAAVSMVTVEAETQRVNVTADPQQGSDTFPHLERNSIDANRLPEMRHERAGSSSTDNSNSRKSIVGGDKDRAEVLAAVRKGILKRSGSASPTVRPVDALPTLTSPPAITDSPNSSAPSTPNEEAQGHRRTGSVALGTEDYFMTALRLRQDTKSAPGTPQGSLKRSAKFSQRIVFHDTWPPQEYDRRGEVATCNRLTPLLAQQIKEELNTFKMEMEVHENSKIYTHFF